MMRNCQTCGTEIATNRRSDARFCNKSCRSVEAGRRRTELARLARQMVAAAA